MVNNPLLRHMGGHMVDNNPSMNNRFITGLCLYCDELKWLNFGMTIFHTPTVPTGRNVL